MKKLKPFSITILVLGVFLVFLVSYLSYFSPFAKSKGDFSKPKVSFIIPVYNVEKYLPECLDSVIHQTLKEIEIVCVNDGSTDNSLEILEDYQRKDSRIKIISQENRGLPGARNTALNHVTGEYILFLDSDDFVTPKLAELCYKDAGEYKEADVVEYTIFRFNDGEDFDINKCVISEGEPIFRKISGNESPYEKLGINRNAIWNKLWKTSFIKEHNLRFKEGLKYGEDLLFNYFAFPFLKSSVVHNSRDMAYIYRKNREGAISFVTSQDKLIREVESRFEICDELLNNQEKFTFDDATSWLANTLVSLTYHAIEKIENIETKREYSERLSNMLENYLKTHYTAELLGGNKKVFDNLKVFINGGSSFEN